MRVIDTQQLEQLRADLKREELRRETDAMLAKYPEWRLVSENGHGFVACREIESRDYAYPRRLFAPGPTLGVVAKRIEYHEGNLKARPRRQERQPNTSGSSRGARPLQIPKAPRRTYSR